MKSDRRGFLGAMGLGAGAALLAPMFRGLHATARADAATPYRFVVVTDGNGFEERFWSNPGATETSFALPDVLSPLERHRADLTFVSPLYNPYNPNIHGSGWATLSVVGSEDTQFEGGDGTNFPMPSGISLDRHLARTLSASAPFDSINLGLVDNCGTVTSRGSHVSADGRGAEYPLEVDPVRAYDRLFASLVEGAPEGEAILRRRRSLLDFVGRDVERFSTRLGAEDRRKTEQYLASIRAMELRLAAHQLACGEIPRPDPGTSDQREWGPVNHGAIDAHLEVTANALACGVTNVAAISVFGGASSYCQWNELGADGVGHHDVHHAERDEVLGAVHRYTAEKVASFWDRLRAIPEGEGTLADRTVLLFLNSGGGGHHTGRYTIPAMVLGNLGGRLRSGRWVTYARDEHCVSDLFVTLIQALGIEESTFGNPEVCRGPLAGWLT